MSKPKRIILVRHAESEGNVNKKIYQIKPDYALELTDLGREQAFNTGQELINICEGAGAAFYVSPFFRTRRTYQEISKSIKTIKYYEDPRLREQEWGTGFAKGLVDERERYASGHFYYRFENGESPADVYDRISDLLNTLHRDFEKQDYPENVIIITHGMALRVFLMRWLHWSVEEFESVKNPKNAEYFVLENKGEKFELDKSVLRYYNKPTHEFQFKL